jgi:hypothetical protein
MRRAEVYGSAQADKRIRAYIVHLEKGGIGVPYVSRSHAYLREAYAEHGRETVDSLLREHWDKVRPVGALHFG